MESLPIQGYDLFMLVILVLATVFGAWKGMAWQIASLASLVVSYLVAMRFSGQLAPYISRSEPWNRFLAILILFLLTSLAIWILFRMVADIIDRVKLKEFDRQMGALFGLAKGVLFCLLITFFAVTLSEGTRQSVLNSHSGKFTARLLQRAGPIMPEEVRDVLGKYVDQFERKLDPDTPPEMPAAERARELLQRAEERAARRGGLEPVRPAGQESATSGDPPPGS
jgi:membrane protein required for colicin V production